MRIRTVVPALAAAATALIGVGSAAAGESLIVLTATAPQELVLLDSAAPATPLARRTITGLLGGEQAVGIDVRPATGELFLVTSTNRMLVVDALSGAARQVGASLDPTLFTAGSDPGFDFNPTVDRLRMVNVANDNLRFNPVTSAIVDGDLITAGTQRDTDLAYIGTDANTGADPGIAAVAYDRNDTDGATPTTLLGIDSTLNTLVRQGAVDGNAADAPGGGSPNGGLLTTLAGLGVDVTGIGGFDIGRSAAGGEAGWAALQRVGDPGSTLYAINVTPTAGGAPRATAVGPLSTGLATGLTAIRGGFIRPAGASSGPEGGQASVTVERIGDTLDATTVTYRTTDGSAVAGQDYTALAGTLAFAQGERTKQVAVPLAADGVIEGPQSFGFEIAPAATNAYLIGSGATVQITEPDTVRPTLLIVPSTPTSLRALRRSGRLQVTFSCSEACSTRTTISIGTFRIASGVATLAGAGVGRATVRLSVAGRKRLDAIIARRGGRVTLTVLTTATDAAGNTKSRTSVLRLMRR